MTRVLHLMTVCVTVGAAAGWLPTPPHPARARAASAAVLMMTALIFISAPLRHYQATLGDRPEGRATGPAPGGTSGHGGTGSTHREGPTGADRAALGPRAGLSAR